VSVHYDILLALQQRLVQSNANLLRGINRSNIKVRSLPKIGDRDALPCILIAPYGKTRWEPVDFEGNLNRTYFVEVAVVAANNDDFATKQSLYQQWADDAEMLVSPEVLAAVPSVWRIEVLESPVFDRSKLSKLYAYQSIVLKFDSQEPRTR